MRRIAFALAVGFAFFSAGPGTSALGAQTSPPSQARPTESANAATQRVQARGAPGTVSQAELVDRIRQSGVTREEAQSALARRGHDPTLADPYFDAIEGGGEVPRGSVSPQVLAALEDAGIIALSNDAAAAESESVRGDGGRRGTDSAPGPEDEVFGQALFANATAQFSPDLMGPVDPDYRLGPNDELWLILTGDVEATHKLVVSREGMVIIPDVGQVAVNGLTLGQLEDRLYDRLGRVYSGVRRGSEATTRFQLSLGRLRVNQVYVIGEVARPSAYQVSAASTVLDALYQAGGPNQNGSFRAIDVYRGGQRVATVDLYEYLLHGRGSGEVRLEHGDRVFVRPYGRRVKVRGAVRRPATYELVEGEDLRAAIEFAGGLDAKAIVERVLIDRILPPEMRRPGIERVLIDVSLSSVTDAAAEPVELRDGDVVEVFTVAEERRNRVVVEGAVQRPGTYEWSAGLTLFQLLEKAHGLTEAAYTARAHVYRLVEDDGSRRLIQVPLVGDSADAPVRDFLLSDRDSVVVYSRAKLRNEQFVSIDGFVKHPGTYRLADGMTVQDLVLAAGGFTEGADTRVAEVARMPEERVRTDTTAVVIRVLLADSPPEGEAGAGVSEKAGGGSGWAGSGILGWLPDASEHRLRAGDRVFIRKAVGYDMPRTVKVTGEVLVPGTYVLETREARIVDILRRAGGPTAEAYLPGVQLHRKENLVATDVQAALSDEGSRYNLTLEPGDSVHVPAYNPTVLVTGAVAFETLVLYEPGKPLSYYVNRAGGYLDSADRSRVTVTYMDGERATTDKVLVFRRTPGIEPGSTIHVPEKPVSERGGFNIDQFLSRTTGILTSAIGLWVLIDQIRGDG